MEKQTLDIQQMQHLQELGLVLKETLLYWARCVDNNPRASTHYGKWVLIKGNSAQTVGLMHWEFIPAFTLQDVLSALPKVVEDKYKLCIEPAESGTSWDVYYYASDITELFQSRNVNLIDAAYELLVWCIENKYVETLEKELGKKNEKK